MQHSFLTPEEPQKTEAERLPEQESVSEAEPEPIDVTAFEAGVYTLVIHTLNPHATPGKYVMQIDRILTVEQNGLRMAERNYPPALLDLWKSYQSNPNAVEAFVAGRKGKGPIIESIEGDTKKVRVTYLYLGDENTTTVRMAGGAYESVGWLPLQRFPQTNLFFASETIPRDARYTYDFEVTETRFVGEKGAVQLSERRRVLDALNPETFDGRSALSMPSAPAQPYVVKNDSAPQGKLTPATVRSVALQEDRPLTVYVPPGYDGTKACNLLIVFDGEFYGNDSGILPAPTILNNLIAARKIRPTIAVFVHDFGKRLRDLTDYPPFADFIGKELVPWARKSYRISDGASHVVAAGSSLGGLSASYCAFKHPEAIGNALSLSGSYWITRDWQNGPPWPLANETGDLVGEFRQSKRLPIRFYIAVGRFEGGSSMLGTNRELRDILLVKGNPVTYQEFNGVHDAIWWRGALADGCIALMDR